MSIVDVIGYLATIIVLSSFMVTSQKKLRIINAVGCAVFVVYGFLLKTAWPVIITNGLIILIHGYYFMKEKGNE